MLEKLTTHNIQDGSLLFSLADKCAKATEGRAWHSPTAQAAKRECKPNARAQAQGSGNSNKKKMKKVGGTQPPTSVPTTAAAAADGAVAGREVTNAPVSHPIAGGQAEGGPTGGERRRDGVIGCQEGTEGCLWPL
jgi:hypothetical protein